MSKLNFRNYKIRVYCLLAAINIIILGCIATSCGDPLRSDNYIRGRSVKLIGGGGQCSGEQVQAPSGESYILSAGHCHGLASVDGSILVETEDGKALMRRVISEDPNSDLLLIEGVPNLEGLEIASDIHLKQHIRTFTHGRGLKTYRTDGDTVQEQEIELPAPGQVSAEQCNKAKNRILASPWTSEVICMLHLNEMITTAKIVPGSSGGMVVDDDGRLVGVASATDGVFGMMVRLVDIRAFLVNY